GCHESFYLHRCVVCEDEMIRKRTDQRVKSGHGKCRSEYRRFPRAFDYPGAGDGQSLGFAQITARSAHFTGLKIGHKGDRPRHRALRHWSWHSEEFEHELRDADSTLLARIESNAGRHRLTHPRTTPILSWPDLNEAKRRAESIALSNLPLIAGVN